MKWENPPSRTHGGNPGRKAWAKEANELRENPGQWGIVAQHPNRKRRTSYSLAHQIISGKLSSFQPRGTFEATARKDGLMTKVYARYIGTPAEEA